MKAWPAVVLLAALAAAEPGTRGEDALRESVLRLAAGDAAGAEAEARIAVDAEPENPAALQQLARAADAAFDYSLAEESAGRALELGAPTPALLCLRSEARSGKGDYDGALADARAAARLNPGSGLAALRGAVAKEGMRRPAQEALADYRRAAELDASLAPLRDAAIARLSPPKARPSMGLGGLIALLAVSGAIGWMWARLRGAAEPAPRRSVGRLELAGAGRLDPQEAARVLSAAAAAAADPESALALAESLYHRLTGLRPYPAEGAGIARRLGDYAPASAVAPGLPVGIDAFFARALAPDPARRFKTGAELSGAFRSLVDPAID